LVGGAVRSWLARARYPADRRAGVRVHDVVHVVAGRARYPLGQAHGSKPRLGRGRIQRLQERTPLALSQLGLWRVHLALRAETSPFKARRNLSCVCPTLRLMPECLLNSITKRNVDIL
jgi:hypothetical protein